jgi:hypothetical protein
MVFRLSNKLRLLAIFLFFAGVVSVSLAFSLQRTSSIKRRPAKGFTIVTRETITMNDPASQAEPRQADYVITTRYQKSDGTWKEVKTAYKNSGKVLRKTIEFGIPGLGAFHLDRDRETLEFLSAMPPKEVTSYVAVADGHNHPNFLRDDVVQGYHTYVLHYLVDKDGYYEDEYYAIDLDGQPVRSEKFAPYGHSVTEPVQILLGDPDDSVFSSLPDWVISYKQFERKIQALEDDGKREVAAALRRDLQGRTAKQLER